MMMAVGCKAALMAQGGKNNRFALRGNRAFRWEGGGNNWPYLQVLMLLLAAGDFGTAEILGRQFVFRIRAAF